MSGLACQGPGGDTKWSSHDELSASSPDARVERDVTKPRAAGPEGAADPGAWRAWEGSNPPSRTNPYGLADCTGGPRSSSWGDRKGGRTFRSPRLATPVPGGPKLGCHSPLLQRRLPVQRSWDGGSAPRPSRRQKRALDLPHAAARGPPDPPRSSTAPRSSREGWGR